MTATLAWPDGLARVPLPADLPALPEPVDDDAVRRVAPGDSDEPLRAVPAELPHLPVYAQLGIPGSQPAPSLREGVVTRLLAAQGALPDGFGLMVLDGWRTRALQGALYDYYAARTESSIAGFVADPTDDLVVPPHVTGGAVDLTLTWQGEPLPLGTDYDAFEDDAHLLAFEGTPSVVRDLRRLLGQALTDQGFAPYPLEWWHWSYGDQRWAAQRGVAAAVYGAATT